MKVFTVSRGGKTFKGSIDLSCGVLQDAEITFIGIVYLSAFAIMIFAPEFLFTAMIKGYGNMIKLREAMQHIHFVALNISISNLTTMIQLLCM